MGMQIEAQALVACTNRAAISSSMWKTMRRAGLGAACSRLS